MSIWQRLNRVFDALSNIELDEVSRYGAIGEEYAQSILSEDNCYTFINRIIPHPQKKTVFLEIDTIIYAEGNVFCVEIKNYKGKIYFPERYKTIEVEKKFLFWKYSTVESVFDGYDDSKIVKEKEGNYGEGVFYMEFSNPLKKTKYFIYHLKQYLSKFDSRFSHLYIIPIVGFSDTESDISAIHSVKNGMVYVSEIQEVIKYYRNEKFANSPSTWIVNGLKKIPSWDIILTRKNERLYGIIIDDEFKFKTIDGIQHGIPYNDIVSIFVDRTGLLSAYDEIKVLSADGKSNTFSCVDGQVNLDRFGEHQIHKLRNINQIRVGTGSLR
ncbi:Nuclease-related domain protein [uncultured archaeon]|nr:Nuclease-related domain protein [uncultured archaeon]